MASAGHAAVSIRYTRVETRRVTWALALSLAVHLLGWGTYELGKRLNWWELPRWPHWVQQLVKKVEPPPPPPVQVTEPALTFLDVSQESPTAPEKAKYYSNKNSRAANQKLEQESNQPDIQGKQKDMPKTEDVLRPVFSKNPPAPATPSPAEPTPQPEAAKEAAEAKKATTASKQAGDLTMGKPTPNQEPQPQTQPETQPATKPRPRTLKQARAQQAKQTPGQAMALPGGVHKIALSSSLDAKATPFGAYDAALVDAVTSCWWDLLESRQFALDRTGRVTVHFRLNEDGTVSEVGIKDNNVGELLGYVCANAIEKAAPFGPWPSDLRKLVDQNFRDITFTFYYY